MYLLPGLDPGRSRLVAAGLYEISGRSAAAAAFSAITSTVSTRRWVAGPVTRTR